MNEQSPFQSAPANASLNGAPASALPSSAVNLSKAAAPIAAPDGTLTASATSGSAVAPASSPATGAAPAENEMSEVESLVAMRGKGASWFFWIVGLSIINTIIASFGSDSGFSLGLATTLLSDGLASESIKEGSAGSARFIALFFDLLVFAFYAFCGVKAMRGASWAFVLGLVFFALDTLIMLAVQEWLGVALHVWAIISLWSGLSANNKLKKIQLAQAQAAAPNPWSG